MNFQSHLSDTPSDSQFFYHPFSLGALLSDGDFSGDHIENRKASAGNVPYSAMRTLRIER